MLVDQEPGYERLHIGDSIEATTEWCPADTLPPELVSRNVPVRIERIHGEESRKDEYVAHADPNVSALLHGESAVPGDAELTGCLMYDRYLHLFSTTVPVSRGVIVRRGVVTRKANRLPTRYPGWYSVNPSGPATFVEFGERVPSERTITWDCVEIDTEGAPSRS